MQTIVLHGPLFRLRAAGPLGYVTLLHEESCLWEATVDEREVIVDLRDEPSSLRAVAGRDAVAGAKLSAMSLGVIATGGYLVVETLVENEDWFWPSTISFDASKKKTKR